MQPVGGVAPPAPVGEVVPVRDEVAQGAGGVAIGDAARHAAGRLFGGLRAGERFVQFLPVVDAGSQGRWAGTRRPRDRKASGLPMAIAATAKGAPGHAPTLAPTPRRQVGAIVTFAFGVLVNRQVGFRERFRRHRKDREVPSRAGKRSNRRSRREYLSTICVPGRPALLSPRSASVGRGWRARTRRQPPCLPDRPSRRALLARLAIRSAGASAPALALLGAMTPNEAPGVAQPAAVGQHFRNPIG